MPASLRSDGVRGHPGMPFGIIPDSAFGFAGIPINLRKGGTVHKEASCTSQFAADKFEETMLLHSLELQWMAETPSFLQPAPFESSGFGRTDSSVGLHYANACDWRKWLYWDAIGA